ncbi:ATP-binding cassette domain-containing protein [Sedimentitalea todarodis]|uniref:ATP-binding cassette domain-containing protein n=1 Tax=Sedimentitalea todarodis TaxID=1631240 RepID=A0ABU3VKQ1_9RHOB|nr:ATP-binding cassette domain-containing protein [Sedimentitalea todarodis]MDU9006720.1 ATP-binding cassette domain-containing protein [Sedimentitalea todarodis]
MEDAKLFLHSVLAELDGRHSPEVIDVAFGESAESLSDIARASNLLGLYASHSKNVPANWRDGHDGALISLDSGHWVAVVRKDGEMTNVPSGSGGVSAKGNSKGFIHLRVLPESEAARVTFARIQTRARRGVFHIAWQSLAINLCALTVPFFTMAVYDRVLGAGAVHSLPALLSGAAIVLATMLLLRFVRSGLAASEHANLAGQVSILLAGKAARSPMGGAAQSTGSASIARIRQGERAADLFSSANIAAIYDAPFILLTFLALVVVGGAMAIVPAVYLVVFLGLGYLAQSGPSVRDPLAVHQSQRRQTMVAELVETNGAIQAAGLSEAWLRRFDATLRSMTRDTYRAMVRSGGQSAVATTLGSGTALVTLMIGIDLALSGHITPGILIGTMLLTWRITGPAQALYMAFPRLASLRSSWSTLRKSMSAPTVARDAHMQAAMPATAPDVSGQGLYFRFDGNQTPAVSGVTFDVPAGSIVAVIGANGSGKSTLLQMIAGRLPTMSGQLTFNGHAATQFDPDEISLRCAYIGSGRVPKMQGDGLGKEGGLIMQSDAEYEVWTEIQNAQAKFFVLDNPLASGGKPQRDVLAAFLETKRGNATVFLSTHDTELVSSADLAIVLDGGSMVYFGPVQKNAEAAVAAPAEVSDAE